jgi:very-short-patch-repair endonuclease
VAPPKGERLAFFKGRIIPTSDTKPEMTVRKILEELSKELNFSFKSQQMVPTRYRERPYVVDFMINDRKIIEVMGRRFHDRTKTQRKKVSVKLECLKGEGYDVLIIWDDELKRKKDLPAVKEKIREFVAFVG